MLLVRPDRAAHTVLLLAGLWSCSAPEAVPVYPGGGASPGLIAVVGDLQRTSCWERLAGREQNDLERARIVAAIAGDDPAMVVLLGDLVFDGSSDGDWRRFDALMTPVRALNVPILPVLGNHDYRGCNAQALENLHARFTSVAERHWQSRRQGRLGLIWLDSNQDDLGPAKWASERQWLETELRALDDDPTIQGVLVFVHHPPYTNSTRTKDEAHVQEAFVPPFVAAHKTLAMIAGHAHGYEHFLKDGKHFVVSAGGGGPRVAHLTGAERRHPDEFDGPTPRPYHTLRVTQHAGGVRLEVVGFDHIDAPLREIDRVELSFSTD